MIGTLSPENLFAGIARDAPPVVLDVCIDADFTNDPRLIPTARRLAHDRVADADLPRDRPIAVVCQKGKKLSMGAAALLCDAGYQAAVLEGGNEGWDRAGLPRIPVAVCPANRRWATAHGDARDTTLCAWMIRRFFDIEAHLMIVSPVDLPNVASLFQAAPFGPTEGGFAALRTKLMLDQPLFDRFATAIRATPWIFGTAADPTELDTATLAATFPLLDRAYTWAVDQTEGAAA
ncbi:rhodanese-like domain-containing protein [Actibacterium sp. 188UL27-1]|uniref:rhodanese-like domain-containing protein n=1 Tax=Actibacterium sp. 188UL27-1 TaxID=2786961 RepID=UPI001958917A|nr:rhodanese-like domain-containing protein [Actibacterium sp. 188UL27-1]MBM7067886.1 hypothetical protein [Actibacterium sp. 188UL27-1]